MSESRFNILLHYLAVIYIGYLAALGIPRVNLYSNPLEAQTGLIFSYPDICFFNFMNVQL